MTTLLLRILSTSLFFLTLTQPASLQAYTFSIDNFEVIRNGLLFRLDTFGDGLPPPDFNGDPDGYTTTGTFGPESGGKLTIDSSGAVLNFNIAENAFILSQRATLRTNIDPNNLDAGLKNDDTFSVTAIFDLILPAPRETYFVRLTDAVAGVEGSDLMELGVARTLNGDLLVRFRDLDDPANTVTIIDSTPLETNHSQICLRLERPDATDNSIFASFAYIDGGGVCGAFTTFANTADIFDGENFTRVQFGARSAVPAPEPSTLMLLGSGLFGLGLRALLRRRKS